jgi:ribosomal protein L11 methyltransferase
MTWLVAELLVEADVSEAVADSLRASGADGVAEEWRQGHTYVRAFWHEGEPAVVRASTARVIARLQAVGLLDAPPATTWVTMEDADWLEGWKQYFAPLEISPRLAIVPSWEPFTPGPAQAVVILDPGMAFGTGTHGTTYSSLQALDAVLQPGMAVADVGTGSGILAIAAAKLGAGRLVATDTDPLAIAVARDNASRNGVEGAIEFQVTDLLTGIDGPFALLIANILAPVILALLPALPRVLTPGGLFISSGYITAQDAEIAAALQAADHTLGARYEREGWVARVSRWTP